MTKQEIENKITILNEKVDKLTKILVYDMTRFNEWNELLKEREILEKLLNPNKTVAEMNRACYLKKKRLKNE